MNKPIIFSEDMIKALPDKTQTRRTSGLDLINGTEAHNNPDRYFIEEIIDGFLHVEDLETLQQLKIKSKYGMPGDKLGVKENYYAFGNWQWHIDPNGKKKQKFVDITEPGKYQFFENPPEIKLTKKTEKVGWYLRPALFMPENISRHRLIISEIKCERLLDISKSDAIAEGMALPFICLKYGSQDPVSNFKSVIASLNGSKILDQNPWVWVVKFQAQPPLIAYKSNNSVTLTGDQQHTQ